MNPTNARENATEDICVEIDCAKIFYGWEIKRTFLTL